MALGIAGIIVGSIGLIAMLIGFIKVSESGTWGVALAIGVIALMAGTALAAKGFGLKTGNGSGSGYHGDQYGRHDRWDDGRNGPHISIDFSNGPHDHTHIGIGKQDPNDHRNGSNNHFPH